MEKLTYCPFIKGDCRSDCVFYSSVSISLTEGKSTKCSLAAFIRCSDNESIVSVCQALKNLRGQTE